MGGVNLLDYSWNKETYWNGAVLGDMQGSNELIYALLAINARDSLKESRPESVTMTEQQMIDKLLGVYQAEEGGFGLSGPSFDVDITGMALQALAPYYNTREDVKEAVDKAVNHLSQAQVPTVPTATRRPPARSLWPYAPWVSTRIRTSASSKWDPAWWTAC